MLAWEVIENQQTATKLRDAILLGNEPNRQIHPWKFLSHAEPAFTFDSRQFLSISPEALSEHEHRSLLAYEADLKLILNTWQLYRSARIAQATSQRSHSVDLDRASAAMSGALDEAFERAITQPPPWVSGISATRPARMV